MSEIIDNSQAFDPELEPLTETIPVPDDDPRFVTNLAIEAASGKDQGLFEIEAKRFYAAVEFVKGNVSPQGLKEIDQRLRSDKAAYIEHQRLHDQK